MDRITLIGTIAATCTTISFFPQVVRIYRTKHTRDLSLPMYMIFSTGLVLWIFYGFLTKSIPVIVANAVTFVLCMYIFVMKIKYK